MAFENLIGNKTADPRFEFGLSTDGLKDIFVWQGLPNNCDATARLIVYKYLEKVGKATFKNKVWKTVTKLDVKAEALNKDVDSPGYVIPKLYGGTGTWINISIEKNKGKGGGLFDPAADYTKGLSYLDGCLKNGIPVIIGIGIPGYSSGNPDATSDHFIVCVGKAKGGGYYYYDTGGQSGINLNNNILKPFSGKPHLFKDDMPWTASSFVVSKGGDGTGTIYLTSVFVYPIHIPLIKDLKGNIPVAPVSKTDTSVSSTGSAVGENQTDTTTQEKSRGDIAGQEGSSSSTKTQKTGPPVKFITQLVEPTIKAKPIKVTIPSDERLKKEITEGLGFFPIVWYGSYQIRYNDIQFFQLYTSGNIPTVKIVFDDTFNLMKDKGFPLDDSLISIFINPRTDQLKTVHMDFKIVKFSVEGRTYTMTGVLNVNLLYIKKFKSYSSKTSFEALKSIAQEAGLGFASNIDDTDDSMIWINPGKKNIEFMEDIVNNSYKSDEAYLASYIDFYYNLTYVEVEKELRRNIEQELGIGNVGVEAYAKLDKDLVSRIFLTNNRAFSNTNSYFSEYRIINNSSSISLREGYSTKVKYYDETKKDFLVFDIEALTTDAENSIVLKGAPQDEDFYKENKELVYLGKLDEDNMYKNYHYSYVQNYRNLIELEKIGIEVTMKTPNFNLYRFQKVIVNIASGTPTPSQSASNNRLTGQWLIIDIMYRFDGKVVQQIIKLVRKELSLSSEEAKKESGLKKANKESGRGTSTNPDPGTEPTKPTDTTKTVGTQSGEAGTGNLPDVTNESSGMASSVPAPPSKTGKTSPSGYTLKPGSYIARERTPTQIMLHYSAGWQITDKCQSTTKFVSETRGLTYNYIISVDGHIENLVDPKFIATHGGDPPNQHSIGISLECLGTTFAGNSIEGANKSLDGLRLNKYQPSYKLAEDEVYFVDINGNRKKYRNLPHGQEVSIKQLNSLRALLLSLKKRFPTIPSFNGLTSENFNQIFPEKFNYTIAPGLYTHNSANSQKSDIAPTPRLVSFLKSLRY